MYSISGWKTLWVECVECVESYLRKNKRSTRNHCCCRCCFVVVVVVVVVFVFVIVIVVVVDVDVVDFVVISVVVVPFADMLVDPTDHLFWKLISHFHFLHSGSSLVNWILWDRRSKRNSRFDRISKRKSIDFGRNFDGKFSATKRKPEKRGRTWKD